MPLMAMSFLGQPGNPCAMRLAEWLEPYPAKVIAGLFQSELAVSVEPRTAKGWKSGNWPQGPHLQGMVALWGESFLFFVFAPLLGDADAGLDRAFDRLERQISLIRKKVADEGVHGAHLRGAARSVIAGAFGPGDSGPGADLLGQQLGGTTDYAQSKTADMGAGRRRVLARAVALSLMLLSALHGPIADVLSDGDFRARMTRGVRIRAGIHDFRMGGGAA